MNLNIMLSKSLVIVETFHTISVIYILRINVIPV